MKRQQLLACKNSPELTPPSLFFPSVLAGPSFTYASYDSYVQGTLFASEKKSDGPKQVGPVALPRGRFLASRKRLAVGIFYLAVTATCAGPWGYAQILEPWFLTRHWLYKCALSGRSGR